MHVIIGCGNLNRHDDGVGVVTAQRLQAFFSKHPQPNVHIFDAGTGGMDVMFQARGARSLIIIDACVSGSEPGAIFKLGGDEVTNCPEPSYSLHDFRWDHALYAGQQIFKEEFPKDVTVYLIEAADTSFGLELTPLVAQSIETVCEHIRTQIFEQTDSDAGEQQTSEPDLPPHIQFRNGNIYIDASISERYFPNLQHVVLLKRDTQILILPVHHEGGAGLLLKIRNAQGDRVIHAQEFFREHGIDNGLDRLIPVSWDDTMAGLVIDMSYIETSSI